VSPGRDGRDDEDDAAAKPEQQTGAVEPSPAGDERAELQRERDELRRECSELKDALLRRRAEFENYKKRVERDQRALADDVASDIFRRLVDTADNLERALAAQGGEAALRQGVELTLRELQSMLESHEVAIVDPLGERFDPLRHQALIHEAVPGYEEGTVAEVFRKGYTYKDRLLRPALVKVASGEAGGSGDTGEPGGADGI
jgi:molecular chaperone GrpE